VEEYRLQESQAIHILAETRYYIGESILITLLVFSNL